MNTTMPAQVESPLPSGRIDSQPQTKRPNTFLFIDSSNGGINAKPDKFVRSFVMKSARNKKSWSTRPRSPESQTSPKSKSRRRLSSRKDSAVGQSQAAGASPGPECTTSTVSRDDLVTISPESSRSDSISSHQSSLAYTSPASCFTSLSEDGQEDANDYSEYQMVSSRSSSIACTSPLLSFECLALRLTMDLEGLLQYFVGTATPRLLPIDPYGTSEKAAFDWITNCIQSPIGIPFIYAALTTSSRVVGKSGDVFKGHAVAAIQGLISDPKTSTSDETIAAVLILLAVEEAELANPKLQHGERTHSMAVNETHTNGLRTMILHRGGLAALDGNRCLQVCLLMHSIAKSVATFRPPYALLHDVNGEVEDYAVRTSQPSHACSPLLHQFHKLNLDPALLNIISTIAIFTLDLRTWYQASTSPVDALELQKHASLLLYRLYNWTQQNHDPTHSDPTTQLSHAIALAALIFLATATEPTCPPTGPRLSKAVSKLRAALHSIPLCYWNTAFDVLLWTLTMGALGAQAAPHSSLASCSDYSFFIRFAQATFRTNAPVYAEALSGRVETCLWVGALFDERARRVWCKMGLCEGGLWEVDYESVGVGVGNEVGVVDDEYALGESTAQRFFAHK